jgi:hypothetical protein
VGEKRNKQRDEMGYRNKEKKGRKNYPVRREIGQPNNRLILLHNSGWIGTEEHENIKYTTDTLNKLKKFINITIINTTKSGSNM